MTYLERIEKERDFTVMKAVEIAKTLLPYHLRKSPWSISGRGTRLLKTEDEMNAYLAAYAEMHMVKCRVALQNFPFDFLPSSVEIVDWGCGQGIATMTLMEMLRERNLDKRVRKITLVEPSGATLGRAVRHTRKYVDEAVPVNAYEKYLPTSDSSQINISDADFSFGYPTTIHLFSNILDITTVDLERMAELLYSSGSNHYVVCTGPCNDNAKRIDEFCSYFNSSTGFADITSSCIAYTSDTHHPISCKVRGLFFSTASSALNQNVITGTYSDDGAYDDYDRRALVSNGFMTEAFARVYEQFAAQLGNNDSIFIKPLMEGDNPDLVIVRPYKGVLVVKVFDDKTDLYDYQSDGLHVFGKNAVFIASPIHTVRGYKDNLRELYSKRLVKKNITNKSTYYSIKCAVVFTQSTEIEARSFCNAVYSSLPKSDKNCISILGMDSFSDGSIWTKVGLNIGNRPFDTDTCNEIIGILSSDWHSFREGIQGLRLSARQKELVESKPNDRHKIKGFAGSGKTQVLASRAVHSHLRTGKKILILTYNITLCNYIRYRIAQIPADFLWNNFQIMTYYRFFTSQAKNLDLKLDLSSYDDPDFFEQVRDRLPKYSAILIDEVQDYHTIWMEILQKYFLEDSGEFIVFCDTKQNIYKRPLDEQKLVTVPRILGRWNVLKRCFRVNNISLLDLAIDFQKTFMAELPQDEVETNPEFDYSKMTYINLGGNATDEMIYETCRSQLDKLGADINRSVVLSQTCEILRDIEYLFRTKAGVKTSSMCETVEVYNILKSGNKGNITEQLSTVRENKKHHFTMLSQGLKLSTVHSYKGWEAETVILLIQPVDKVSKNSEIAEDPDNPVNTGDITPEVIYTAITRSSKNLIVVNLGVDKYDDFFRKHILAH